MMVCCTAGRGVPGAWEGLVIFVLKLLPLITGSSGGEQVHRGEGGRETEGGKGRLANVHQAVL